MSQRGENYGSSQSQQFFHDPYQTHDAADFNTSVPDGLGLETDAIQAIIDSFDDNHPLSQTVDPSLISHDPDARIAQNRALLQSSSATTTVATSTSTATTSTTNPPQRRVIVVPPSSSPPLRSSPPPPRRQQRQEEEEEQIPCPQNMTADQRNIFLQRRQTQQRKRDELEQRHGILPPLDMGHPLVVKNGYNEYASVLTTPTVQFVLNESATFFVKGIIAAGDFNRLYTISIHNESPVYAAKVFDKMYVHNEATNTYTYVETQEQFDLRVEREYRISMMIRQRHALTDQNDPLTGNMLTNDLVLAQWEVNCDPVAGLQRRRAIIYPFFPSINLKEFVETRLDFMRPFTGNAAGSNQIWRLQVFRLCRIICKIVAALHEIGVYHRDIRLENFVIQDIDPRFVMITDSMVRLVGLEKSCTTDFYRQHMEDFFIETTCSDPDNFSVIEYSPHRAYADPRTFVKNDGRDHAVREPALNVEREKLRVLANRRRAVKFPQLKLLQLWPAFEAYSVAVCIQFIIDREQRETIYEQYTVENQRNYSRVEFRIPTLGQNAVISEKRIVDPFIAMMKALTGPIDSERKLGHAAREFARLEERYMTCHPVIRTAYVIPYQQNIRQTWLNMLALNVEHVPIAAAFFEPHQTMVARMRHVWEQSRIPILPDQLPALVPESECKKEKNSRGLFETLKKRPRKQRNEDDDDDNSSMPFNQWLSLDRSNAL